MRNFFPLLAVAVIASGVEAAVIQGVALDQDTGAPLARTLIQLIPVEGTRAQTVTLRAGERGAFAIMNVIPGWYILRATRKVYAPTEIGQARPNRPGRPFQVERDDQSFFLEARMTHTGAVSGVVLDENNTGLADWDIHIFSLNGKKAIKKYGQAKTDDRGVFRIWGLEPGNYVVRSGEGELEDGTMLVPTYHKYGTALESAEPVTVRYGETATDLRLQPAKGKLHFIEGSVGGDRCDKLTFITDSSRRLLTPGSFRIERVPPGRADLLAEGPGYGGILHLNVDRDLHAQLVPCQVLYPFGVGWEGDQRRGGGTFARGNGSVAMRRVDLDGIGEAKAVKSGDYVTPGTYEVLAMPSDPDQYASAVWFEGRLSRPNPDGSFPGELSYRPGIGIGLRSHAPQINGTVLSDGKPVIGAPVYIESFDSKLPAKEQRLRLWSLRTDLNGKFSLHGLLPGRYRVLSSFDFDPDDLYAMDKAPDVVLKEGDSSTQELKMLP